ncbi:MAG TPA: hypothetical protein VH476_08370 [Solirubrobacterales bacterium]|jgi:hypothetical protein
MRLLARFLPLALLAALLAAGCGSGGSTVTTTPEAAETTPAQQSGAEGPTGVTARACRHTGEEALLLRVSGVSCAKGESVATGWGSKPECVPAPGNSRSACTISGYRCLTTVAGRGFAVTCARPERSIAFIVRRG